MHGRSAQGSRLAALSVLIFLSPESIPAPDASNAPRFSVSARISAGRAPGSVAVADLNGDGDLDVIVANEQDNSLTVLLGDGAGRFTEAPGSPVPAGNMPNDIAWGRFDDGGVPDVAVANHESDYLTLLIGDGRGSFRPAAKSPTHVRVKPHPHGIAAADFDGDGNLDLVTDGFETDEVELLRGDGTGAFASFATLRVGRHPYQRVRAWDMNRDGTADVVTANLRGASVTVLAGDGRGSFREAPGSPFPSNPFPTAVAFGDFNADGRVDLGVANSPSNSGGDGQDGLTVLLADASSRFHALGGGPAPTGAAPTQLAAGDLDGDGGDDIAVSNMNSSTVSIARVEKGDRVVIAETIRVGRLPKGIAVGDLNGDDKRDLVVANNGDNDVAIILAR